MMVDRALSTSFRQKERQEKEKIQVGIDKNLFQIDSPFIG